MVNLVKIINDRLNKKMVNYYTKTEVDNKVNSKLSTSGGTITGIINASNGGKFALDGNVYVKCNGYDGWLTAILDNIKNETPKIVYSSVVSENTNVVLSANSMYILFSMMDINHVQYNQYITFLTTGNNSIQRNDILGGSNSPWSNLPTNGLIQGLYPKSGYIHTCIIKVY